MTLRHDRNIVLTKEHKIYTAIRNTDLNIPVGYHLYMSNNAAKRRASGIQVPVDDVGIKSHVFNKSRRYVKRGY